MMNKFLICLVTCYLIPGSIVADLNSPPCKWPSVYEKNDCERNDKKPIKKPPGLCDVNFHFGAKLGLKPFRTFNNSHTKPCYDKCKESLKCQMAVINQKTHVCSLYEEYGVAPLFRSNVFKWEFCNFTVGKPVSGRCNGQWMFTPYSMYTSNDYQDFHGDTRVRYVADCKRRCQNEPVCGAFNYDTNTEICKLVKNFNSTTLTMGYSKYLIAYLWICAKVQNYTIDPSCVERNKNCSGNFKMDGKEMDPDYLQLLLKYHTHNFSDCLANCERMSMCRSLLYSTDYAHCLLMSRSPTICSVPLRYNFVNHSRYMSYVRVTWHCCHSPRISKLALKSGFAGVEKQQSGEWPCGCLTSTNVFVKRFDCNAYSGVERFMDNQTCKNARIHCSVGQCFRILKTWGNTRWWFYLVYTGYENFVFRSHNASFVHIAGSDTCQFYSASVLKETQRIINRTEWGASDKKNTKRKTIPLKLPVPEVLIGNLTERLCFCRTREACANLLVDAQQRHFHDVSTDFPYNFMIGPDGNVFEGLGWLRMWRSSAYESLNPHLLVVFVGNFTNSRPHLDAVMAGRRLIQTGVSMGHIAVNYSVRLAGSLSDVNNTLYTVVGLWPHYQGRTPLHCSIFHHITVLVNFLMVVLIVALIIAVVRRFFYPSHSRHCAGLLTDLQHCGGESSIHVHNIASRRHQIDTGSPEEEPLYYLLPELRMPLHQRFHIQYASCFWLSPTLSQRSQHRSCRCALSLLLQQHQATATPLQPAIHLPSLAPLGSSCSWASLVLFCPSFSILQPSIIVIAHLPNTDSRWLQRTICTLVANFQARRCFCRRRLQHLELSKLQTKPQSHDFVIMDPRKIVHRPVQHCKFWTNFTGLPYLVLD